MKRTLAWIAVFIVALFFASQLDKVLVYSETAMLPPQAESYKAKLIIDKYFKEAKNNTLLFVILKGNATDPVYEKWYFELKNNTNVKLLSFYDIWNNVTKNLKKLYDAAKNFKGMYKGIDNGLASYWAAVDVLHYIMVMNGIYSMNKTDAMNTLQALLVGTPLEKMMDVAKLLYDEVKKSNVDPTSVDEAFTLRVAYLKLYSSLNNEYAKEYLKCLYKALEPKVKGLQLWPQYPMDYEGLRNALKKYIKRAEPEAVKCFAEWFSNKINLKEAKSIVLDAYYGKKPNLRNIALRIILRKSGNVIFSTFLSRKWTAIGIRASTNDYKTAIKLKEKAMEYGKGILKKVYVLGPSVISKEMQEADVRDAERVQELSHVLVLAVLFGLTRSVVATIIPFIVVGIGIVTGMALAFFIGHITPIYHIAKTLMMTTGLGLGMDYSIFILSRFKEEAHKGLGPKEAAKIAAKRAGHAVGISAVAASLGFLSLALSGTLMLNSMGITIPLTVLATAAAAITMLPEILGIIGEKRWFWWPGGLKVKEEGRSEVKAPRLGLILLIFAATIAITIPSLYFYITYTGSSDTRLFIPRGTEIYEALVLYPKYFPAGAWGPLYVVGSNNMNLISQVENKIKTIPHVAAVIGPKENKELISDDHSLIIVILNVQPFSSEAMKVVKEIREVKPKGWLVGGMPAELLDTKVLVTEAFWSRVAPFAILATMVVLFLAVRRIIPVISAAYGLTAAISWAVVISHLLSTSLFGEPLYWITPLIAFVATLGIGTDYNVFYISRVIEEVEKGSKEPFWAPLKSVATVILGLASIMASAYFGMLIASAIGLKQMGLALGFSALFAALNAVFLNPVVMTTLSLLKRKR